MRDFLRFKIFVFSTTVLLVGVAISMTGQTRPSASAQPTTDQAAAGAMINQYCMGCHNATVATAGVVLDPSLAQLTQDAELWERVIRQLHAQTMPPTGLPRPEPEVYTEVANYLSNSLDSYSAANPNPGELPQLHRLTRTEYQNAVRDLIGLDNLPKELDYTLLLPADNASSGFDNLADLLFVSPTIMDRYLEAAMKVSRLAVGDPEAPALVNLYRTPSQQPQDFQQEGLPFGTRGGLALETYFPLDGEYVFDVAVAGRGAYDLEISIDGERVHLIEQAPPAGGRGGFGRGGAPSPEIRIPVKAGPRLVGVTFAKQTDVIPEGVLKSRPRSRGDLPAVDAVTISGPYNVTGPGNTPSREKIFSCYPQSANQENACANEILSRLTRLAYRRPISDEDLADIMEFYTAGREERNFDYGIQSAIERLLVSPQFMYRIESDPAGARPGQTYRVTDLDLASRLSFFLWSSIPDEELIQVASEDRLHQPEVMRAQVLRMLGDARAESMITNFASQWLYLRDVPGKEPDLFLFQGFDENLREAFETETNMFLESILLDPERSVLDLLTANHTYINERLAEHYGIPNVRGSRFRRYEWPEGSPRAGLLGQGSILLLTSYSTRTSPVLRGKYVLENLLASPPPPPPPDVPSLNTSGETPEQELTLREAMTLHRQTGAVCAGCHARMDPIGFAMENFDAVGRWRDLDGGQEINTVSELPNGSVVDGVEGVRQLLLSDPERFVGAVAEKLLMYAASRNVQYYDMPAIREIVRGAEDNNYSFASLVANVANSVPFQMRTAIGEDGAGAE